MTMGSQEEEHYAESDVLRAFVGRVKDIIASSSSPTEALAELRAPFARLLADRQWLPQAFREPAELSGMGGGIGQWLIYRSADRSLSLFSLVVPPRATTPVHDHLIWGLVGLYEGTQKERVYRLVRSLGEGHGELEVVAVRELRVGDFYDLLPPENDIHSVLSTSPIPSVSIHLLSGDLGCIMRHQYDPEQARVRSWRSGYVNAVCEDETTTTARDR